MAIESIEVQEILEQSLAERNETLQEKQLPEINIGEAVPVEEGLDFSLEYVDFGVRSVAGSVKDGIIGNKTNALKTIDSEIDWMKAQVGHWAKATTWTMQEVEKITRLGLDLPTAKQDDLYANALATIQYSGYVGHQDVKGQEGLLTSSVVQLITDASGKTLDEMTADEVVEFILSAYNAAWKKSGYRVQPTTIALDAEDYMLIMQKFSNGGVIVGTDLLPVSAMDRIMAALRKASGNDTFNVELVRIPSRYAVGIKTGKTRLAVYTKDSELLEMKVHMPELLPVRQRDLLTFECGYRTAFSGCMWKQPQSAVYVDYKSSKQLINHF